MKGARPRTHRVGIVGAGSNTRARHIPGLRAIPGVEIVSVCNSTPESSRAAAQTLGIPRVYESWQELVAAQDTDAIVIGTWPDLHCPVTLAALASGKHVLCEARMAMDHAEARRMRDAARARPGLVAQVVPAPYTLGVDETVARLLVEGYLGRLLAAEVRGGGAFHQPDAPLHWRQDVERSGRNILGLGIWYEVLMRWIGEATRVAAMGRTYTTMRRDETGLLRAVRVPEHLDVIADMACGAQAHLQVSAVAGHAGPPEVLLYGSDATLRVCDDRLYGGRRGDEGLREIVIPDTERGAWRVEAEFVEAIRGAGPVRKTTFADGVRYMAFTEAVGTSLAEGRAVTVPV